ncbi:hypothetical protein [Micromonospora sp. WMMD812]|uniref:hypothetical protein n=1 Tax=Micromonospora sp. WMMD812 TaxID=3015152 RepID=UPI00248C474B|nr:hypothetical protein [Micromonospora sp. WMMD812]WBB66077.1 hypothetical protein O7603_23305 [Micromonospora sp. WMMD812]
MGVETGDRLNAGVLAGATVLALVFGGWWWRASAPATGPTPGAPSPSPERVDRFVPSESENGAVFHVDPSTGAAFRVDRGPDGGDPDDPQPRGEDADGGLPWSPNTFWRERTTISPERGVTRQSAGEDGVRYLLQGRCSGPGDLLVVITGSRSDERTQPDCDGSLQTQVVTGAGTPIRISLTTVGNEPVRVEAQLVGLD